MAKTAAPIPPEYSVAGMFSQGISPADKSLDANHLELVFSDSAVNPQGWNVLQRSDISLPAKAAYAAGRVAKSVITDGDRRPYWLLNHELARIAILSEVAARSAGLAPDYKAERLRLQQEMDAGRLEEQPITTEAIDRAYAERMGLSHQLDVRGRGVPLALASGVIPLVAAGVAIQASGNHDFLNAFQGGRAKGFEAVIPQDGDPTQTANPIGETAARYFFGRSGRLLPWEQFTEERPDVSPEDYQAYKAHQFDKGLWNLGVIKGTGRNLEGEPEYTMLGFRMPLSATTAVAGSVLGAVAGANMVNEAINQQVNRRLSSLPGQGVTGDALAEQAWEGIPDVIGRGREGHRRILGAVLGGTVGAIAGKLGGQAVNSSLIQPALYPERVAAQQMWLQQQQLAGLI